MAGVGTGSLQIPKRSMERTQASRGQPGEPSAAFRGARGYLGSLVGKKGLGRRGQRGQGVFVRFLSAWLRESLEPGSQEGVLNCAFETAPHLHLTRIPPLPQVTTPHLLISGLVHYLINGLTRTGKSQPFLYLGLNKQPMWGLCGGTAEPAVGSKLGVYR